MDNIHKIKQDRIRSRRAVAPIIATLLMIAIAVVGGVMIYVFTQGFFGNSNITTSPGVDTITMTGYDMREIVAGAGPPITGVTTHEGAAVQYGDIATGDGKNDNEEGTIYIKNVGQKLYSIAKLEVNGKTLLFESVDNQVALVGGDYAIYTPASASDTLVSDTFHNSATIMPGQEGTLLVSFDGDLANNDDNNAVSGRTIPVKITSAAGSVFNFNVVIGSKS